MSGPQPTKATINIDINKLPFAKCKCGNTCFETVNSYKLLSALVSPSGQEQLLSIPQAKCPVCASIYSMEEIVKLAKGISIGILSKDS